MKLSYFDLISPCPIHVSGVGDIFSPTLRRIAQIGAETYNFYLSLLLADEKTLFSDDAMTDFLKNALAFFFKEEIFYYSDERCFIVTNNAASVITDIEALSGGRKLSDTDIVGVITGDNFSQICDLILQLNNIKRRDEDISKVKNKKALDILKKIQKGRAERQKNKKADKNMEIANIISAVANRHPSLNMINIWDLTIYQLWDAFARLSNNSIYDIQSMSVAAWGDKDNHFDAAAWFKRIE